MPGSFGPIHVVEPRAGYAHDRTAILLHGRGSTGEEFADELFATSLSDPEAPSLADRLPTWRWVFPSSPSTWNATFEEWMPAWFEAHSLADPSARQDLQQPGLLASVRHVGAIVAEEAQRLLAVSGPADPADPADPAGVQSRLVLGGISLGGAVALWTLLAARQPDRPLGGFVVASTWLPFVDEMRASLVELEQESTETGIQGGAEADADTAAQTESPTIFVRSCTSPLRHHLHKQRASRRAGQSGQPPSILTTPVFMGHGRDDAYVDIVLGRQAHQLLVDVGFAKVQWQEYEGAEQEGHWLKEPEEMDDLARFLQEAAGQK